MSSCSRKLLAGIERLSTYSHYFLEVQYAFWRYQFIKKYVAFLVLQQYYLWIYRKISKVMYSKCIHSFTISKFYSTCFLFCIEFMIYFCFFTFTGTGPCLLVCLFVYSGGICFLTDSFDTGNKCVWKVFVNIWYGT